MLPVDYGRLWNARALGAASLKTLQILAQKPMSGIVDLWIDGSGEPPALCNAQFVGSRSPSLFRRLPSSAEQVVEYVA